MERIQSANRSRLTAGGIAMRGLIAAFALSLLLAGCKAPTIVRLTVTSPNETVLRPGNTVKFAADVRLNGSVLQTSNLTLQRVRPSGPEITRPLAGESVTGDPARYTATVLPSDPTIAFQPGDRGWASDSPGCHTR